MAHLAARLALIAVPLFAGTAHAADVGFLDKMAEMRNEARGPRPIRPLPPAPDERLASPHRLLICMSVPAWTPIQSAPEPSARKVGYTTTVAAVTAKIVPGFVEVELNNGKGFGYVPRDLVTPFRSDLQPNTSCTVGIRSDGRLAFQYQ